MTLTGIPIQLELTTRSNPPVVPVDLNTDNPPRFWRGEDVIFNLGVFDAEGFCVDLSNLAFLELDIYPGPIPPQYAGTNYTYAPYSFRPFPSVPPVPLLSYTVPASAINPLITRAGWICGAQEQAQIRIPWMDTLSLNLGGCACAPFWFVVHGIVAASSGDFSSDFSPMDFSVSSGSRKLTYGGGVMTVYESGDQGIYLPNAVAPLVVPADTILLVEVNQQLPFALPIQVDGTIQLDGALVDVNSPYQPVELTDNAGNPVTDNLGNPIVANTPSP